MNLRRYLHQTATVVALFLMLASCVNDDINDTPAGDIPVKLRLHSANTGVRSSYVTENYTVDNINIMWYRDGILAGSVFTEETDDIELRFDTGTYRIYALANIGHRIKPSPDESGMKKWRFSVQTSEELGRIMLLTGIAEKTVTASTRTIELRLKRITAKCGFRFEASGLPGMRVTAARICQAALDSAPFDDERSVPDEVEESGDYAGIEDIDELNKGGTVYFYTLENAQGVLLEGNTDSWKKVPDSIPQKAGRCTYIEVEAEIDDNPDGYYGEVLYRFFLGQDAVSDFSVLSNTLSIVTLTVSKEGLGKVSWMIDTSGLDCDPLAGFTGFAAPGFVGQWSTGEFPGASEKYNVEIEYKGRSIIVGPDSDGIDSLSLDNGITLYYDSGASRSKVFLYATDRVQLNSQQQETVNLTSSRSSIEETVPPSQWPLYLMRNPVTGLPVSSVSVNEDGWQTTGFRLVMGDRSGNPLSPASFATPDVNLAADLGYVTGNGEGDLMGRFIEDMISPVINGEYVRLVNYSNIIENGRAGCRIVPLEDRSVMMNGNYVAEGTIYGRSPGSFSFAIGKRETLNGKIATLSKIECTVLEAFPEQRYVGGTVNELLYKKCSGTEGLSDIREVDLYCGSGGTGNAEWSFVRVSPDSGQNPDSIMFSKPLKGYDCMRIASVSNGRMSIEFLPPAASASPLSSSQFFACGAFCFRGSVTNPFTGRTVKGYYMLDIILDFSIIAQVDFIPGNIGFYYVPYNVVFASPKYSYNWSRNLPLAIVPDNLVLSSVELEDEDRTHSQINGDTPLKLVPFPDRPGYDRATMEYRVNIFPNSYENSNHFPFSPENITEISGFFQNSPDGSSTDGSGGILYKEALAFRLAPLDKNGNITEYTDILRIGRDNYMNYPAFEGFYNIMPEYYGKTQGNEFEQIGHYVMEASGKAQAAESPFYSDRL